MVRNYKRKSDRGSYGGDALMNALKAIENGACVKTVGREYGIPCRTLRRHRDKQVRDPGKSKLGRYGPILPDSFEKDLVIHIQAMEKSLFGLTTLDVRKLAFELAEIRNIPHPFNQNTKIAGEDWLQGFLKRHTELSIRSPQGTSLNRAVAFNRPKVSQFFSVYKEVLNGATFTEMQIWNMDETGITNVQKPGKILASKGIRQVGKITSGERGSTVTVICGMNAGGQYIPPMFIFPRKRMADLLMKDAPAGAIGFASDNGWTNCELFLQWLQHFVKFTKCSKQDPQVIILDGHHSHKTLAAVMYARENGLTLITLPPHCTHKMQPLDRTFFKALKSRYNSAADNWMSCHPGKRISFYDMAGIFTVAFNKAATIDKAVAGFKVSGIWPLDDDIFSDDDFAASAVTDEPQPEAAQGPQQALGSAPLEGQGPAKEPQPTRGPETTQEPQTQGPEPVQGAETRLLVGSDDINVFVFPDIVPTENLPSVSTECRESSLMSRIDSQTNLHTNATSVIATPNSDTQSHPGLATAMEILNQLSPPRKIATSRQRKRKVESATVLTSSPYKKSLEEKEKTASSKKKKKAVGQQSVIPTEAKKKIGNTSKRKTAKAKKDTNEASTENTPCAMCQHKYLEPPFEPWFKCAKCELWLHESCGPGDCDLCYACV